MSVPDQHALEGLAARAVALVELGRTDVEVVADIAVYLARFDMLSSEAVREVAGAIRRLTRPKERSAEELEAMFRARAVLEEYATYLEQQG